MLPKASSSFSIVQIGGIGFRTSHTRIEERDQRGKGETQQNDVGLHPLSPSGSYNLKCMMHPRLLAFLALPGLAAAQFFTPEREPAREWMHPLMGHPTKVSADRFEDAEYPSIARADNGDVWVAWSSCRPETDDWPSDDARIESWMWPDDGQDHIVARRFDGRDWHDEMIVSALPGVNHKPAAVPDGDGVRILWTARRDGRWAAYERRWSSGSWSAERQVPGTGDVLEIRARRLDNGSVLAVVRKMAAPRIELHALVARGNQWGAATQLDEGEGRAHRPHLLALPDGGWQVAWDEERDGNYDVYARAADGDIERITTSKLWDTSPTQAVAKDGRAWIAWERREPIGGRFTYRGRSIFAKIHEADRWVWAPSPFESSADPGRLTRHSRFWAAHAISEERYPQLLARENGELWLLWLGGGRMSSVSFTGRVLRDDKWSEPKLVFHDPNPYSSFQLPAARRGVDLRSTGRGPYQTPLANQMSLFIDDRAGDLWMAYEVPRKRHITDNLWSPYYIERPGAYGADIYSHRVDLDEKTTRFQQAVDDQSPIAALEPPPYRNEKPRTLELNGKTYELVWGDMHGHTENDGIGTFDMYYAHGLFVTGMHFVASSNHDFTPDFLTQSEWAEVQAIASIYNQIPGRTALSGWEWTTSSQDERGGHRAMYFLTDDVPLFRSTTKGSNTVYKLYSLIRPWGAILQPHHNNWTGYDAELQPVFEITSAWRQAREEATAFRAQGSVASVWEALERGYRIGFVGSGDSHWMGTGEDYGITGAYVEKLDRQGVFEAIRSKRVFASTGARMLIDFRVEGAFMGEEIELPQGPVKVEVSVEGDADLEALEVVKDHKVIHAARGSGMSKEFSFVDQGGPRPDGKASYYYLRVRQKDQMYAWTSPVWVDWRE